MVTASYLKKGIAPTQKHHVVLNIPQTVDRVQCHCDTVNKPLLH
jgi:hypothetical protein